MTSSDTAWDDDAFRARVQAELDTFLGRQVPLLAPLGDDATRLLEQARVSVAGGKRFRAAFCYWGFRALGFPPDEAALVRACASLELLHASALVHDDYMDGSDTRRGRPSTHVHFAAEHASAGWSGPATTYGAAAAILLGDLLLSWADELLRRSGFGWDVLGPAMEVFDACRTEVIAGQFLDVSVQARASADVETAMTVLRYKSAKYSIERPLHLGAALAGASAAHLSAHTEFGLPLGEAFQLRDDVLGVFGDPDVTGKPAGDDLVEGKRTVLVAEALARASAADAALLDRSLGSALAEAEVERLRGIISSSGALDAVEARISALTDQALTALRSSDFEPDAIEVLTALADAATQRSV
ncbi:polyprenyl synthetase family protein [Nocardioides sp. Kera G14]|uniref:polyprenyl synthetase family protein n=1 Tax=Nocardioides sp. Kera G14 TaxID=2884264 RepID=UPI001D109E7F|nr:polyprenyl synthetase family protein [Nocardioides sp. Kera G14]UDY22504.1 polyprenyl synthetase family protein [Nocardioides sp. Kera G14]